jgi:hypothetical protein
MKDLFVSFDDRYRERWSTKKDTLTIWPNAFCKLVSTEYGGSSPITGYIVYRDKADESGCRPAGRAEDAWANAWVVATTEQEQTLMDSNQCAGCTFIPASQANRELHNHLRALI